MVRGQNVSCSCFGLLYKERVGWSTQFRDGLLLLVAVFALLRGGRAVKISAMAVDPAQLSHALGLGLTPIALAFAALVGGLSAPLARRQRTQHTPA